MFNFDYKIISQYTVNCSNIVASLSISLGRKEYHEKNLENFMKKIAETIKNNGIRYFDKNKKENIYKIKKVILDVGDTLNRFTWYYKYLEKYLLTNKITKEELVSKKERREFLKKATETSKQQGIDWFYKNLKSINQLIPDKEKYLTEKFKLKKEKTILYKDTKFSVEFISHEYWRNHTRSKEIIKALNEVCKIKNSPIQRAFEYEATNFYENVSKYKKIYFKDIFIEQSMAYLKDEFINFTILYDNNNTVEFYLGALSSFSQAFNGSKAQNNPVIQKYLQGPLKGADQRKFIQIKITKESK